MIEFGISKKKTVVYRLPEIWEYLKREGYICFVDADDYADETLCEQVFITCEKHDADICLYDYQIIKENQGVQVYTDDLRAGFFDKEQILKEILAQALGHIDKNGNVAKIEWSVCRQGFRRDFLLQNHFIFDVTLANSEDCLFSFYALCKAERIYYLKNQSLYYNIRNSKSATRRYLQNYWQQRLSLIQKIEAKSHEEQIWETVSPSFSLFVLRCVRPSFTNISYGFENNSPAYSIKEFREIVNAPIVVETINDVNGEALEDEYKKIFIWCKNKQAFKLYCYYKDVYQKSRFYHQIRKIGKRLNRMK